MRGLLCPLLIMIATLLAIFAIQLLVPRPIESQRSFAITSGVTSPPFVDAREVALLEKSFDTRRGMIEMLISLAIAIIGGLVALAVSKGSKVILQFRSAQISFGLAIWFLIVSVYLGYYAYESLVIMADAAVHNPASPAVAIPATFQLIAILVAVTCSCLLVGMVIISGDAE